MRARLLCLWFLQVRSSFAFKSWPSLALWLIAKVCGGALPAYRFYSVDESLHPDKDMALICDVLKRNGLPYTRESTNRESPFDVDSVLKPVFEGLEARGIHVQRELHPLEVEKKRNALTDLALISRLFKWSDVYPACWPYNMCMESRRQMRNGLCDRTLLLRKERMLPGANLQWFPRAYPVHRPSILTPLLGGFAASTNSAVSAPLSSNTQSPQFAIDIMLVLALCMEGCGNHLIESKALVVIISLDG